EGAAVRELHNDRLKQGIQTVGKPAVDELFKAIDRYFEERNRNPNRREALYEMLALVGRKAQSPENVTRLEAYAKKEGLYPTTRAAAYKALQAVKGER